MQNRRDYSLDGGDLKDRLQPIEIFAFAINFKNRALLELQHI